MFASRLSRVIKNRTFLRCFSSNTTTTLNDILRRVSNGELKVDEAESLIQSHQKASSPEALLRTFANLDHTRSSRTGFPEAVFAENKTPLQVSRILDDMARHVNDQIRQGQFCEDSSQAILATR